MPTLRDDVLLGGRYRIGGLLGRGGMAEVYDGFDERLHRNVAVKVLRTEMAADAEVRRRFEHEARSAARLNHPNVVAVFDTGEDGDVPFLVMERLPGETLADRMRAAGGGVDADWLLRVAGDVLLALGAAHAAGIVHRDVKPGNILIGADGCAKVADFGIAKTLDVRGVVDLTTTGRLLGTPAYLAPERLAGAPATPGSDLYALGVVLYEALTGAKPTDDGPPLADARPGLPAPVAAAVDRAMAEDPRARFATAHEMAAALGLAPAPDDPTIVAAAVVPDADPTVVLPTGNWTPEDRNTGLLVSKNIERVVGAAVGAAVLVAIALALTVASFGRTGGNAGASGLGDGLRGIAAGLTTKDGPAAPTAADELRKLASVADRGGGAAEANALLGRLASWRDQGQLTATAADRAAAVVAGVPGANGAAYTPPTTAPPPPATAPVATGKKGKGHKHGDG